KVIPAEFRMRPAEARTLTVCWSGWIPANHRLKMQEKLTFWAPCTSPKPVR
ncbi:hypothetical protein P7K49_019930, partial [Saguinus oedipus]